MAEQIRMHVARACRRRAQGPVIMDATIHFDGSRRVLKALLGPGVPSARMFAEYALDDFPEPYFPVGWHEIVAGCELKCI